MRALARYAWFPQFEPKGARDRHAVVGAARFRCCGGVIVVVESLPYPCNWTQIVCTFTPHLHGALGRWERRARACISRRDARVYRHGVVPEWMTCVFMRSRVFDFFVCDYWCPRFVSDMVCGLYAGSEGYIYIYVYVGMGDEGVRKSIKTFEAWTHRARFDCQGTWPGWKWLLVLGICSKQKPKRNTQIFNKVFD